MTNAKIKKIGIRRYVNWVLFLVAIILICFLISKLYTINQSNKLEKSVLSRVVGTIQYNDIDDTLKEFVSDDFILISYVKSENTRKLELKLKNIIINNELQNNFYYLDATDMMLEDNYINDLNNKLSLKDNNEIKALPALLYYHNGELIETISSDNDSIMSSDEFSKLIDMYEIGYEYD